MVVLPSETRVIEPDESMVATFLLPEEYVTVWFPGLKRVGKVWDPPSMFTVQLVALHAIPSELFTTVRV